MLGREKGGQREGMKREMRCAGGKGKGAGEGERREGKVIRAGGKREEEITKRRKEGRDDRRCSWGEGDEGTKKGKGHQREKRPRDSAWEREGSVGGRKAGRQGVIR